MREVDIAEAAYKNGYEKGKEDAKKEFRGKMPSYEWDGIHYFAVEENTSGVIN
jgi:hypothetical protein